VIDGLRRSLPVVPEPWIALEANPEDVTAENVSAWREMGVTFLSLGIQSFDDTSLEFLGRCHHSVESRTSVAAARAGIFETLSIDLIYGLAGQSADDWRADLQAAVELRPDHLSCYQLTIEEGTPFGYRQRRGQLTELSEQGQAELFFLTHRFLADHGFEPYEVSSFATSPDHHSRHNTKYWDRTPYLGVGPSAHSFAGRNRWWNERKIKPYEQSLADGERPIQDRETLTPAQLCLEQLLLGLRTFAGVDLDSLPDDWGERIWQSNRALIENLTDRQLVVVEAHRLCPTLAGMALAESIARNFKIEGA
jgi:oxygen-independent coproporphyrinogen-3 oxidase